MGLIVTGGLGGVGESWISIHNGGGVGISYSPRAGMIVVADAATTLAYKIYATISIDLSFY